MKTVFFLFLLLKCENSLKCFANSLFFIWCILTPIDSNIIGKALNNDELLIDCSSMFKLYLFGVKQDDFGLFVVF